MQRLLGPSVIAVVVLCSSGLNTSALSQDVIGAGSTFVNPVLTKWTEAYKAETGVRIGYQAVGSGTGIWQVKSRTVDFGASDAPLRQDELNAAGLVQFPIVVGGVVPVVNLEGIRPGQLRLTGVVLADIFLRKITKWNAKAISDLNPGLTLPDQPIIPIHRVDGSGTTFVFADYLARVNAEWKDRIGVGMSVEFPTGVGAKGNDGVAGLMAWTKGAIGYVEYTYAVRGKLSYVSLQNRDGAFVLPGRQSFESAVANADWTGALASYASLADRPGSQTWPVTGATFMLIHKQQQRRPTAIQMLKFFDWTFRTGAKLAEELEYVPMPKDVVPLIQSAWGQVKDPQGQPTWSQAVTTGE
jgi:phosphate transport system substrate-binding protein